jgi:hypothetical protein
MQMSTAGIRGAVLVALAAVTLVGCTRPTEKYHLAPVDPNLQYPNPNQPQPQFGGEVLSPGDRIRAQAQMEQLDRRVSKIPPAHISSPPPQAK